MSPATVSVANPRSRRARWGAAGLALLAVAGYVTLRQDDGGRSDCVVAAGGARLGLARDQAANAATIGAVAISRGLPERALTIALATAMQESGLRNLSDGDRDSLGLFQQRPSQGWGTRAQITDPVYAAGEFFDELVKIPGYARLPLTVAAQRVQRSGFPRAYARHEADASLLADALTGRAPSLTCQFVSGPAPGDPSVVTARLEREFGARVLRPAGSPGPPGPEDRTAGERSRPVAAGIDGATVTVPVAAADPAASTGAGADPADGVADPAAGVAAARHGWTLARWAVAHAAQLRIAEVRYRERVWRASSSQDGWTWDRRPAGRTDGADGTDGTDGTVRITVRH